MSVAVAAPVPVPGGVTAKESDLLEALLASCQKHTSNPALPGYGRELEPYFALKENLPQPHAKQLNKTKPTAKRAVKNINKGTDQKAGSKKSTDTGTKPIPITPNPKQAGGDHSPSDSPKNAPAKKRQANAERKNQSRSTSPSTTKPVQNPPSSISKWAGPGFCVPPSANELPMPSAWLLED